LALFKIGISGAGEPLMNFEKIKYIIEYVEREDIDNILSFYSITNGTLVTKDILYFLNDHKQRIKLNFSLDGYEKLHNYGKGGYKKTFNGIKLYETIFREKPILNCTVSLQTINNKEMLLDYFKKHDFKNINFTRLVDVEDQDLKINHQEYLDFLQFIFDAKVINFRQCRKEKKYDCLIYGQLCGVGRTNIFFSKQGIYPCSRFYKNESYRIANFNASLFEVESKMFEKLNSVKDDECYYETQKKAV
jgi:uncharacterized protein